MSTVALPNSSPAAFVRAPLEAGQDKPGPSQAPSLLLAAPLLHSALQQAGVCVGGLEDSLVRELESRHPATPNGRVQNFELVSAFNQSLYEEVLRLGASHRIVTLGGDHSIAIGSIAALREVHQGLKVVWIDAHADINTLDTTVSGKLHGCPVSFLMGFGTSRMPWLRPCLSPNDLIYYGLRDVEPQEAVLIREHNIAFCDMRLVEKVGNQAAIAKILDFVGDAPVHVSLDVDGLDPEFMGATGTPVAGGLTFEDVRDLLVALKSKKLVSLDVVEVNPLEGGEQDRVNTIEFSAKLISIFLSP